MKNIYKVSIRDREDEYITAERYRLEGNAYVFESGDDTDVTQFLASEVIGIRVMPPDTFETRGGGSY
ncbi:MAG TPA: hypothetical protein VJ063_00400 [Verrucomicrobiae bacterium]|nr:hypothetical protein [Verrucomicrobiae bacterium]